jgi:hypothetical protein
MMLELKMKYKHIYFEEGTPQNKDDIPAELQKVFRCNSNDGYLIGFVLYDQEWGQWCFCPFPNAVLPKRNLLDIANYIGELNGRTK